MFLEFEKQIAELEGKIEELRHLSDGGDLNIAAEITRLQKKANQQLKVCLLYTSPSPRDFEASRMPSSA